MNYVSIQLTKGKVAIIDEEDFPLVSKYKWHASSNGGGKWYAATSSKKGRFRMHSLIMGFPGEVDHADGNGLNNRKSNLRPCTRSQNNANKLKCVGGSSIFKGVYLSRNKKWKAKIHVHRKTHYLGTFDTQEDAAQAYNVACFKFFGEFARPNELSKT